MKKGLTLIELIFTIVVIAIVFTVIPKIVLALNKSDEFSAKQDALFNAMTFMQMLSRLSWDENGAANNLILETNSTNFECNATTKYRLGGFTGSRNCDNNSTIFASAVLGTDGEAFLYLYNDIDDFNGKTIDSNTTTSKKYSLHVNVGYMDDGAPIIVFDYPNKKATIDLTQNLVPAGSSNLKKVDVNVSYQGKKTAEHNTSITQFSYLSANIGKFFLSKSAW